MPIKQQTKTSHKNKKNDHDCWMSWIDQIVNEVDENGIYSKKNLCSGAAIFELDEHLCAATPLFPEIRRREETLKISETKTIKFEFDEFRCALKVAAANNFISSVDLGIFLGGEQYRFTDLHDQKHRAAFFHRHDGKGGAVLGKSDSHVVIALWNPHEMMQFDDPHKEKR